MNIDALEAIRRARATKLVGKDGAVVALELEPAVPSAEIERLEVELGVPLSRELRVLLGETAGISSGPLPIIDFTGQSLSFGDPDALPWALPIAGDGFGNFWVVDLTPEETQTAPVFFACHDAPVILYQSPTIGDFLHEAFRMLEPPHTSAVDDVHEDRLFNVWRENPGTLDRSAALASGEPMRSFAAALDERFVFVDLRSPPVGMGFSWGRYGPRTDVRRHGHGRLFAYAPPEKRPGLLARLSRLQSR
jgi:cell wall assembly regulator SMI1